jgi:hypothetical protein
MNGDPRDLDTYNDGWDEERDDPPEVPEPSASEDDDTPPF